MIINNSMYLNYLNTLQNPSNDVDAADNNNDSHLLLYYISSQI